MASRTSATAQNPLDLTHGGSVALAVFSDAKTARLYDGYVLKGSWVPELAEISAIRDVSEYAAAEDRWGSLAWNDIAPIGRRCFRVRRPADAPRRAPAAGGRAGTAGLPAVLYRQPDDQSVLLAQD